LGAELTAVVFGQHVHLTLIFVTFSSGVVWRIKFTTVSPEENLNENIHRETANIPVEQLQRLNQNLFCWYKECLHVEGQHFQNVLWSVNKGKNSSSF
jgi:hypothetical protein